MLDASQGRMPWGGVDTQHITTVLEKKKRKQKLGVGKIDG